MKYNADTDNSGDITSVVISPTIDIEEHLGYHYNPFTFSYQVFDDNPNIAVTERINGNLFRTLVCDNKDVVNVEIPRWIWRDLNNGINSFTVQLTDSDGNFKESTVKFMKIHMPWYGQSKSIKISGARKPQCEISNLDTCTIKIFSGRDLEKAHAIQDVEINERYFIKEKLENGEHLIHKASTGGAEINIRNNPKGQIILSKKNIDLESVKTINGFEYEGQDAFIILSFDNGVSWNGKYNYSTNKYEVVDLNNLEDVISKSIDITNINDLNLEILNDIACSCPIRLGYVLPLATSRIDRFKMNATVKGVFEKVHDEDYKVEYLNDTTIRITFNSDGTYKVNYLSGELTESEYDELNSSINEIIADINDIKDNGVKLTLPEIDLATDFVPLRYDSEIEYLDGKIVKEIFTGDVEKTVEYKYEGKLITEKIVTDSLGTKKSLYQYDEYSRLVRIIDEGTENSMSAGVIGMPIAHNVKLEYDYQNRVILEVYSGMVNKRVEYEYIGSHTKKKRVIHSNGEEFVSVYTYDLNGNLISVSDAGTEKIYTPLNSSAVTRPRTISKVEDVIVLSEQTPILNVKDIKETNNFNVILNSEILIKNMYGEKSESIVTVLIEQDGILVDEVHLYPQEVQKYSLGSSEGIKVSAKGRISYSYNIGVI